MSNIFAEESYIKVIINNTPITKHDIELNKAMYIKMNNAKNLDAMQHKQLDQMILDQIIDQTLLFQHAEALGIEISDEEMKNTIITI